MTIDPRGQVITFYSYKGGVGRSMALANVACVLNRLFGGGQRVLMVDWDLEAPGLHRFFRPLFKEHFAGAEDLDRALDEPPGLIDLVMELNNAVPDGNETGEGQTEIEAGRLLDTLDLERFMLETDLTGLYLLKAGRFDETYQNRVSAFDWEALFHRSPSLLRLLAERWAEQFQYVLIDSRTGMTDISGICTMLMPEKLVIVFTPNRQSLTGVTGLVTQAIEYRRQSDDLRPLLVFPLPSRIEATRPSLHKEWRYGNSDKEIDGYQPQFESLLKAVYNLPDADLEAYFDEVQIQQVPDYAYGEEIAVLVEDSSDRLSLARSYEGFAKRLIKPEGPWSETEPAYFDVFLSYDAQDKQAVKKVAEALKRRGLNYWLAEEQIAPGESVRRASRKALKKAKSVAVFIGPQGLGEWQEAELQRLSNQLLETETPVIPVLLPGADPSQMPHFLIDRNLLVLSKGIDETALDQLEWGITGKRPPNKARS